MSYILVDSKYKNKLNNVVTQTFDKDTFVVSTPVINGGSLIGVKSIEKTSLEDNLSYVGVMLKDLNKSIINNLFRESYDKDSIVVDDSEIDKGYISIIGTHYGKITLAPALAKMICDTLTNNLNCTLKKNVSEGEIVDCIRRPLGARTVKGVKRRTRAGFGNRHGSYCNEKIISILARELDKKITDIVDDSKNSKIIYSRIKEFKDI